MSRWASLPGRPPRLLVVGGASLDTLRVGNRRVESPGGAGLYTSLAAARAGADVTMLAPYPDPMPDALAPAAGRFRWKGPIVPPERLPRFEIGYGSDGTVSHFKSEVGAEPDLHPGLIDHLEGGPFHLAFAVPFLDAELQHSFVSDLLRRGWITAANTYGRAVERDPGTVRRTAELADVFFCNLAEAEALWSSIDHAECRPGQLVFVTRGIEGATVFQGGHRTDLPAVPAEPIDPTGAGDTFCGTVLAGLGAGDHPVRAAQRGMAAAGWKIGAIGPRRLIGDEGPPEPPQPPGVRIDTARVTALASLMAGLKEATPFAFTGPVFPDTGDAEALDFFSAATLQQFGFWARSDGHYGGPTYATIGGTRLKGSDYLWAAYRRWAAESPGGLRPADQAGVTETEFARAMRQDDGSTPLPALALHHRAAVDYGRSLDGTDTADLIALAAASPTPLASLLVVLDHIGGYREDPLRKKSALLAIILRQRPEQWLPDAAEDDSPPIVDYHVQRTSLRTGMVVPDPPLRSRLTERRVVGPDEESAVRFTAYRAVEMLAEMSGLGMGAVDWFLFGMRHRCPEMTEPDCRACPAEPACAQDRDLFQPVFRTTAY